jgi:probable rRNA maturation factor
MARRVPIQVLPGCRGRVRVGELRRVVRNVLDAEAVAREVEVEVVLADADTVQDLNRLYRGKNEPTDVLSFAAHHEPISEPVGEAFRPRSTATASPAFVDAPDETPSLGEVVVCLPVAEAQAARGGRPVAGEVAHLIVHGLLHLLGHDHENASESAAMQAREDELLAALGYAGGYEHGDH